MDWKRNMRQTKFLASALMVILLVGLSPASLSQIMDICTAPPHTEASIGNSCTCTGSSAAFCETTPTIEYGISNVLFLFTHGVDENGDIVRVAVKVEYGGDIKDPTDPQRYINEITEWLVQEHSYTQPPLSFVTYYIKAGQVFYDSNGDDATNYVTSNLKEFMNKQGNTFAGKAILEY